MRQHDPKVECPVDDCDHKTSWPRDMKRHVIVHHSEGKARETMQCPFCKKQFTREDNLKRHIQRMHDEDHSPNNQGDEETEYKGKGKGKAK